MSARLRIALAVAGTAALLPAAGAAQAAPLSERTGSISVFDPRGVAAGDFNGDGRADLAVTNGANHAVVIAVRNSDGTYTKSPEYDLLSTPRQIAVADFNADGNDDVVIAGAHHVQILRGDGKGKLDADFVLNLNTDDLKSVAVADLDANGIEDVVYGVHGSNGAYTSALLGQGNITFAAGPMVSGKVTELAVGDANGNGTEDVLKTAIDGDTLPLLGAGDGKLAAGTLIATANPVGTRGLAVGDLDGDAKLDVAVRGSGVVSVRLGKGDGTFERGADVPAPGSTGPLAIGDVDGDGDEDLVVGDAATVHVLSGDRTGAFAAAQDVTVGGTVTDLALADLDGDGALDLAAATGPGGAVQLRYGVTGPLAGNLLVNGGFEGDGAGSKITDAPAIPGWNRVGGMTYRRYGGASHAYLPDRIAAARLGGGSSLLWGGNSAATNGLTEASQTVDVSASAATIDAGRATARLSAWFGGSLFYDDRMSARADFLRADGGVAGTLPLAAVFAVDRVKRSALVKRAAAAAVPAGTRRIRVTLLSTDEDKSYSGAMADDAKLTLDVAPPPEPPAAGTPDAPGAGAPTGDADLPRAIAAFGARTGVSLALAGRRGAKVRIRVRNANAFAVRATLRAPGARGRTATVEAGSGAIVPLRLSAKSARLLARRHRLVLRVTATVRDGQGTKRRVAKWFVLRSGARRRAAER